MANVSFNINNEDVVRFTVKLEKLNRSAMPISVRSALNEAAFQMRNKHMPDQFNENFTIRRSTFLRSHSVFKKCQNTFDLNKMESEAGVIKGKSISGDRLELQERGGVLTNRAIPYASESGMSPSRIGERQEAKQSATFYYRKFKDAQKGVIFKNSKRKLIKTDKGVFEVRKGNEWRTLYLLESTARIKPDRFVEPSGDMSGALIAEYFIKNARKRINQL